MRIRSSTSLIALTVVLALAAAAHADVPAPANRPRRAPALYLTMVSAQAEPDAPSEDVTRVERGVQGQLAGARTRIDRCLDLADLREDPLRSRTRRAEVRLLFARNGRPSRVWTHRNDGLPRAAERCVLEAARAIAVTPAPRGQVLVRAVYELR